MKILDFNGNNKKCYLFGCILMLIPKSSSAFSTYTNATCKEITCGQNAVCVPQGPTSCSCLCPYNFKHNPGYGCVQPECRVNEDCRRDQWCNDGKCVSLCLGACGFNARCKITGKVISCVCLEGYVGDPTISCKKLPNSDDPCCNVECGPSSVCRPLLGRPTCFCQDGFVRNEKGDCIHECEVDSQCDTNHYCSNYKCEPICKKCGIRAMCVGKDTDHQPRCICPENFKGDPFIRCEPECYSDEECPLEKPFCRNGYCYNPCQHSCGAGAECSILPNGATACSCPPGTMGDAAFRCDPVSNVIDPCNPNPCGKSAICEVGYTGNSLCAVCNCPPGLKGDPNVACIPGDCNSNSDCFYNQACSDYKCVDVCDDSYVCGKFANCTIKEHRPICSCSEGYTGDPTMECYSVKVQPIFFPPKPVTDGMSLWNSIKNKTDEVMEKMCQEYKVKLACIHMCKVRKETNCSYFPSFDIKEKINNTLDMIDKTLKPFKDLKNITTMTTTTTTTSPTITEMPLIMTTKSENITIILPLKGSNDPCCDNCCG